MRGHLGFRLPRADFLEARITQFLADNLTYTDGTQPTADVTRFLLDSLVYEDNAQPIGRVTTFTVDYLQFVPPQNEPQITSFTVDALTYTL